MTGKHNMDKWRFLIQVKAEELVGILCHKGMKFTESQIQIAKQIYELLFNL